MRRRVLSMVLSCFAAGIASAQAPPAYQVDSAWPKELPHQWIMGHVTSVVVDSENHIWALHFPASISLDEAGLTHNPPLSECCIPAPSVVEFDPEGNVVQAWGGPGYVPAWPSAEQGLWVDKNHNVWITGSWHAGAFIPRPEDDQNIPAELNKLPWDRQVLKFSNTGKLLLSIGYKSDKPVDNQDTSLLGGASAVQVDEKAHEVYVADGYLNRRIVVFDSDTGKFKRGWGANGIQLSAIQNPNPGATPATANGDKPEFKGPVVGLRLSNDGLLYVGDGRGDRIQVFTKQGAFLKEFAVAPGTLGDGSVANLALSRDPQQRFLLVADGSNGVIWILSRDDGAVLGRVGHKGRGVGLFAHIHTLDIDPLGNIYTGEIRFENRLQKFSPAGSNSGAIHAHKDARSE